MKNKKLLLLITTLALTGCGTPTSSDSVNESTSESAGGSESVAQGLTQDKLNELAEGYSAELTTIQEIQQNDQKGYVSFVTLVNNGPTDFQLVLYPETSGRIPDTSYVDATFYYKPVERLNIGCEEGKEMQALSNVSLGLDNELHDKFFIDLTEDFEQNPSLMDFYSDGHLGNFFQNLVVSDFEEGDEPGTYNLDYFVLQEYLYEITNQAFGGFPDYTIDSFTLIMEDDEIVGYNVHFPGFDSPLGYVASTDVMARFTNKGADSIINIAPIEGEEDQVFVDALAELRKTNYHVQADWKFRYNQQGDWMSTQKELFTDGRDWHTIETSLYGGISSDLFRTVENGAIQRFVKINNSYYYNGLPSTDYPMNSATFDFSSKFFTKEGNTYTLKPKDEFPYYVNYAFDEYAFDPFNGYLTQFYDLSLADTFAITLNEDKTVDMDYSSTTLQGIDLREDVINLKYDKIGQITTNDIIGEDCIIKENCDDLLYTDLLAGDPGLENFLNYMGGAEILNQIPTPGGIYPTCKLSYNSSTPNAVEYWDFPDVEEGKKIDAHFKERLTAAGFTALENNQYTKDITAGDVTKTVTLTLNLYDLSYYCYYAINFEVK